MGTFKNSVFYPNTLYTRTVTTSGLDVLGSMGFGYLEITTAYTATSADCTINCTANTFTVTLPTVVGNPRRVYHIKNTGTGVVTVSANGSEYIDQEHTQVLTQWSNLSIQSTGLSSWVIL